MMPRAALVVLGALFLNCTIAAKDDPMMHGPGFGPPKGAKRTWALSADLETGVGTQSTVQTSGDLQDSGYSVFTVRFGVIPPANGKGYNGVATILFTVARNPVIRKVSIGQGVEISGPADSIKVAVQDTTPAAYANAGQPYKATVQIAPGTRISPVPPTLDDISVGGSGIYALPVSGATQTIPVPQGVGVLGAYLAAASNSPTSLTPDVSCTWDSSGVVTNLYNFGLTVPEPQLVWLPPGAISLVAGNRDSTNIATLSVLWVIDG